MQHHFHPYQKLPYSLMYRNLMWLHKELYFLKTKILILVLPYPYNDYKIIDNIYTQISKNFGFNFINTQKYYEQNSLVEFGKRIDAHHQQQSIMREFGKNIIKNIDNFKKPRKLNIENDNPKFAICTPKDMELINGNLQEFNPKNSGFNEKTYRIDETTKLKFPKKLNNFFIIGAHNWNNNTDCKTPNFYSSMIINNEKTTLSKEFRLTNLFIEVQNTNFQIDNQTQVMLNSNANFKEFHIEVQTWNANWKCLNHCDLIAFFLASPNGNYHNEDIDFEALANETIEIPKEYDFNHLIPPVELYKEIIDEYCARMDPKKLAPLQKQISEKDTLINSLNSQIQTLNNEKTSLQNSLNSLPTKKAKLEVLNLEQDLINKKLQSKKLAKDIGVKLDVLMPKITFINPNSAKARIHNHLAYKLGSALIRNSKSFLGYIKMPYVLFAITLAHKEQNANSKLIKLPSLESYADYKEALKEKECFTYKLGEALMKAHKNWYGGGVYQVYTQRCA